MNIEQGRQALEQRVRELEQELSVQNRSLEASREESGTYRRTCENLFALLESMDNCLLVCDSQGIPVLFNSAYREHIEGALGIEMKPGLQPHKLLPDKEAVAYWEKLHRRVLGGDRFRIEYIHDFGRGDLRHFQIQFTPIFEDNHVIAFTEYTRDVTQQKQAEDVLQKEKALFEQLFESSQVAIVMSDRGSIVQRVNKAFTLLFGYTQEEARGRHIADLIISEEYRKEAEKQRKRVWAGEVREYEAIRRRKDGSQMVVSITISPIIIQNERTGAYAMYQDITERKRTETALRESERQYRTLFENAGDAIVVFDKETKKFLDCNQSAIDRYGYPREEWLFMTPFDLHPAEELAEVERNIDDPSVVPHWYNHVTKTGKCIPVEIHTNEILYNGRKAYTSIIRDISERKHAENELRSSEVKFRRLAEHSPFGLSIMRENGEFEYVNPRFTEIVGYALSDIPDKTTWFEKAYPDPTYREKVISVWKNDIQEVKSGQTLERVFTVRCRDGRDKVIHFRNVEMTDGKQYTTYEDVTDRKRLETQLRQAQKMEAIGTLAGGIAHDFNNILSAVIGYTELALEEAPTGSPIQCDLNNVLEAGERARALVNQILTFSRQREQELKPIQIMSVVKEALKLLRALLPSTIDIQQDVRSDALIMGDPTQIHQILMNLCTNAGHAMEETGGILEVRLLTVHLDRDFTNRHTDLSPGSYVNLTVRDTGYGIPREIMERIFDPFFTTKGEGVGTGMGLSVVHGIVKAHGGTITAHSEPGRGATFNVYLPVVDAGGTPAVPGKRSMKAGSERILFVDDEEFMVDLGKQMLERLGYRVVTRRRSHEALELFRANPYDFDLVITDMTMPMMTGDVFAKEIIALRPGMPIILCTGFSNRISEERALDLGIRAFVLKPIVMHEMAETVRRVLDGL